MAFLTIGGTEYFVDRTGASESGREYAGALRRAFDGTLRNMTRTAKRTWTVTLSPMTQAQWETLDAATSLRQPVTVGGTMFGGTVPTTVSITATAAPFTPNDTGHLRTVMLTMQET